MLSHTMAALFGGDSEDRRPMFSHLEDDDYHYSFLLVRFDHILKCHAFVEDTLRVVSSGLCSDVLPKMAVFCAEALEQGASTWLHIYILHLQSAVRDHAITTSTREAMRLDWIRMTHTEKEILFVYFPDIYSYTQAWAAG